MDNTVGSLTQYQKSIIIGSILGDGYLRIVPGRRDALLEVNHSYRQKEYVDWKYEKLRDISRSRPVVRKGKGVRVAYRFNTQQHPELTYLHSIFYKDGKKTIPNIELNPVILSVWFMDDGSSCRDDDVYLNTQQFGYIDQLKIISLLSDLGLEARLNKDKEYWRVRFIKSSLPRLHHLIFKHLIRSMRYKLSYDPVETDSDVRRRR